MKRDDQAKKQLLFISIIIGILICGILAQNLLERREILEQGLLRGESDQDTYEEELVLERSDGSRQDVTITVHPRDLSYEEEQELLQQAVEAFEETYLGENPSADQVYTELVFPAGFCNEMVTAQYDTDVPELIWEDGSVDTEVLEHLLIEENDVVEAESAEGESTEEIIGAFPTEGMFVAIRVTFSCQDSELEYVCYVRVVQPPQTQQEQEKAKILESLSSAEAESRSEERFVLPKSLAGESVTWHKKPGTEPIVFCVLGVVAVVCLRKKKEQDEKKQKQEREKQLLREYPQMVTQLSLLMGAGMSLFTAWERMVKRYLQEQTAEGRQGSLSKRLYLEEMLITYRQIKDGGSILRAYEEFGSRIGLAPYRKMSALLIQNMNKGNRDLVSLLDMEAELVLAEQKNNVRRLGEEAGTKLLFPMLLLFVMILIIIMIPAIQSF